MGPLAGITIVEIAGIGPGPFAGMVLADMGATVIRVERPGGTNLLDSCAPFYDTDETHNGKHVAVGAIEPQFYAQLLDGLGLQLSDLPQQMDQSGYSQTEIDALIRSGAASHAAG